MRNVNVNATILAICEEREVRVIEAAVPAILPHAICHTLKHGLISDSMYSLTERSSIFS